MGHGEAEAIPLIKLEPRDCFTSFAMTTLSTEAICFILKLGFLGQLSLVEIIFLDLVD
jgi:hypothetical protein